MRPGAIAGLLLATCAFAQDGAADPRAGINWATATAERFSKYTNPIVSAYAYGRMGSLVCPHDKSVGSTFFRQSISRMEAIKTELFFDPSVPRLPVASFAGLWKSVSADAILCDPDLKSLTEKDFFKQRLANERAAANNLVISAALQRYKLDPDRATQMADLVLEAGDPGTIDIDGFGFFLSQLRDRAPELSDELFQRVLDHIVSQPARSMANFSVLGKFLFISEPLRFEPDIRYLYQGTQNGNAILYRFDFMRASTNTDLVTAYIKGLLLMIDASLDPATNDLRQNAQFDPATALYMDQVLSRYASLLELDSLAELVEAQPRLRAAIRGQRFDGPNLSTTAGDSVYRRTRAVVALIYKQQFEQARQGLTSIADTRVIPQVAPLIDFAEAVEALRAGDIGTATRLANQLQHGGVKRALLYSGIAARLDASQGDVILSLARQEAMAMPLEFRAAVSSGLANILLNRDSRQALSLLTIVIQALNEAQTSPRGWRFDPLHLRVIGRSAGLAGEGTVLDIPSIPLGKNSFVYVIDTGIGRISFPLDVPATGPFTLNDFLRRAKTIDFLLLETLVLELRDETQRADALLALGEMRFAQTEATK